MNHDSFENLANSRNERVNDWNRMGADRSLACLTTTEMSTTKPCWRRHTTTLNHTSLSLSYKTTPNTLPHLAHFHTTTPHFLTKSTPSTSSVSEVRRLCHVKHTSDTHHTTWPSTLRHTNVHTSAMKRTAPTFSPHRATLNPLFVSGMCPCVSRR